MIDHDHLRALAENVIEHGPRAWFNVGDLRFHNITPGDSAYIAAANPVTVLALLDEIAAVTAERDAYRRGQGPAPTPATPGTTALHETHPIPNSRGGDQ